MGVGSRPLPTNPKIPGCRGPFSQRRGSRGAPRATSPMRVSPAPHGAHSSFAVRNFLGFFFFLIFIPQLVAPTEGRGGWTVICAWWDYVRICTHQTGFSI